MVVWTEERWRSHTPPRLERRRAAHRRRRGRRHKPGCWALHTPRRLERRGAAHQLAGRVQTNNPVWGGSLAVLGLAGKGRLASFSRHSHCMAGPPSEAERPLWRQLRHGMPQQRARRTPHSTQRAAQSHRSDLVALELRGAKLPSQLERSIYAIAPPPFGRSSLGCSTTRHIGKRFAVLRCQPPTSDRHRGEARNGRPGIHADRRCRVTADSGAAPLGR